MKGIKPINTQVSKSQAPRRLNLENEGFHVGSALVSPRASQDATFYATDKKSQRATPDDIQNSGRTSRINYNRQTYQSGKSGKKTSRSVKFAQTLRKEADPFQESYAKPWHILPDESQEKYYGSVSQYNQPTHMMDQHDFAKRLKFEQLKMTRLEAMCKWKQKDTKGKKKNAYIKGIQKRNNSILKIADKTDIEKLDVYTDRFPMLNVRKAMLRAYLNIKAVCFMIISTKLFENISLSIIIVNSLVMIVDNKIDNDDLKNKFELIFQYLYTVEMVFKIMGLGFIFGPGTYMRDEWNILDFFIVMMGYASMILEKGSGDAYKEDKPGEPEDDGGFNVAGLRAFRVARPLKSISSVKGLKVLIVAVLSALPMLKDTILILLFFFVIFSIACTQMFAGKLKNRCMSIQTGVSHPDDILCNVNKDSCPGGYQCFKMNESLNYGVTNWDNVVYSVQTIFQFVTLEGWSEVQRDMQIVENYYFMPFLFMGIVLIGAFFLLNLTLAVINSKFTESQNKQIELEKAMKKEAAQIGTGGGGENETEKNGMNETMSIAQYINARIYAKKMIEFLRMRQEVKRIELERKQNAKIAARQQSQARRQVIGPNKLKNGQISKVGVEPDDVTKLSPTLQDAKTLGIGQQSSTITKDGGHQKIDIGNNVIMEDIHGEHRDEEQDQDKLERDIQDFLMKSKIDMQRQGLDARDFRIPRTIDTSQKKDTMQIPTSQNGQTTDGGPTMKGNIVSVKKQQQSSKQHQMNFSKQLAEELDIDNIIPKGDQKDQASVGDHIEIDSMASFQLSLDNLVNEDRSQSALQHDDPDVFNGSQTMNGRFKGLNTPNIPDVENMDGEDSGLITSDSDFDLAVQAAGADKIDFGVVAAVPRAGSSIKKDVTKAFKKMLTANHMRTTQNSNSEHKKFTDGSTMFGGSQGNGESQLQDNVSFDLESKFKKKLKTKVKGMMKHYKEDDVEENYLQNLFEDTDVGLGLGPGEYRDGGLNASKHDIRQLQEFVNTKKPLDPFRDLNPLTHKVEIAKDQVYQCESQRDVFAPRQLEKDLNILANNNRFIKRPSDQKKGEFDEDTGHQFVKNKWLPYQQKFVYNYDRESSEEQESLNEDELQAEQQPYFTPCRINYKEQTKQMHTQEICKRADVLITSTLSINLFPKDKRTMVAHDRITMDQEEYDEYIDERSMFRSIMKENAYQSSFQKEKTNTYRTNYSRSFLNRAQFESRTLANFKDNVMQLNLNKKKIPPKPKDIQKAEKIKHEQNTRASQKRGLPKFDLESAKKLLEGKFHEEDEEDAELSSKMMNLNNQQMNVKSFGELKHQEMLKKFESELHQIFEQKDEEEHYYQDEIPNAIRKEFAIPKNLIDNQIDFHAIRTFDASHKKIRPFWSGQDVLGDSLDNEMCEYCIKLLSAHRVWPTGLFGYFKRAKFLWRIQVKSEHYDNFFTLFVFLNTITLAMEKYGIDKKTEDFLEETNVWFTWIFIYEMFAKIGGIGINKYLADRMNWLDGFIVMTSIFEMVYTLVAGDSGGLQALNTLRLLRTFRVFRILRLLKTLESMQVILSVMAKSYMSFVYITLLMWLFILIFSLLGMQMYSGYWANDPEGVPANNFDDFSRALFTIFQVLTMENWQSVLFVMNRQNSKTKDPYRAAGLLIPWIGLGNFILLNLFLAILLDAFLVDEEGLSEEEIEEKRQQKIKKKLDKKKKQQQKQVLMDTNEIKKLKKLPELSKFYFGQEKGPSEEDLEDLDEEQIIQIFKEQGVIKKEQHEIQQAPLFVGIECKQSFYVFAKDNPIRILAYKMIKYPLWETVVIILITLSSIKLAYDTFFHENQEQDFRYMVSKNLDTTFNYLFIFEMLMKLIAMGVCMDENSYLRDTWNQMDFFIVMASIFDMALEGQDLESLKVLRMLRTLRPLRFLTHNIGMKLIVNALIGSVGGISNVMLVVAVVILIFAILYVNIYKGKFFYCSIDTYTLQTQQECEFAGGQWSLYDHNFDNSFSAWLTLYIVASLEGWPDIMIQAAEATDVDFGPEEGQPMGKSLTLFIIVIFFVAFFFLNFFIGVLFMKFQQAQDAEQAGYTEKDLAWQDIQRLILEAQPDYEATNVPKSPFRKKFHDLVTQPKFDAIIMAFIMLNMVQMAFAYDGITKGQQDAIDVSNHFFTSIFLIEAILKFIAYGKSYFQNAWNKFDFFVVSASIGDVFLELFGDRVQTGGFLSVAPKVARVMRVLRVTRILRLAGKAESLQAILQTITFSIPALANVFFLLILIYFMLSVLANFQFNNITGGDVIDPDYKNFKNFFSSFVLLFALSTGEDWNKVMFDCSRTPEDDCVEGIDCGKKGFSFIFFCGLVLICSYVMLNLFILVIIQQFEKYYLPEVNMLGMFKNDQQSFMKIWKNLTQDRYRCMKIKENQLTSFFRKLGEENESLGFLESQYDDGELKKQMLKMAIKSDQGYIFFNEMLYRCMRRKYGNMKINKKMQIFELRTQYSIYLMTLRIQNKGHMKQSNEEIFNAIIKKENGVNPFLTVMNFKISFYTWLKVARATLKGEDTEDSKNKKENARTVAVEIEVEAYHEITTEDEGGYNSGESESNQSVSSKKKKKQDSLAKFQKKMSQKLLLHSSSKNLSGKVEPLGSLRFQSALKKQKLSQSAVSESAFKFSGSSTPAKSPANQTPIKK